MTNGNDELMEKMVRIVKANPHKMSAQRQKAKIRQLKAVRKAQLRGENVCGEINAITASLKKSGIIDKNGNLSTHYKNRIR